MSAPAPACATAIRTRASTLSSLTISPSRTMPSWPWALYGSSATSVMTAISGTASLTARVARFDRLSGFHASSHWTVFREVSTYGNRHIAGMPTSAALRADSTNLSTVSRATPGIAGIGVSSSSPSRTNTGQIRSSTERALSRTSRLSASVRRVRRKRPAGYGATTISWIPCVPRLTTYAVVKRRRVVKDSRSCPARMIGDLYTKLDGPSGRRKH